MCCALLLASLPAIAQQDDVTGVPFLIINQERILLDTLAGQALLNREEERRTALVAEARAIDAAFEAEERDLTERRATLPPEEFQALAEDFDTRVVAARQRQDDRSNALAQQLERSRRQFFADVAPVLVAMMDRYDARAIIDENSVLLADQRLNITDAVIAELDAAFQNVSSGSETLEDETNGGSDP
ncbi:MAG: OmpH family outer membrane protein [Pseudomonadota bacterium]